MKKNGINLSKNIAITSASEVKEICMPLEKYFDITYFNYVKLFKNGLRYVLTNNTVFTECYYADADLYQTKAVLNMECLKTSEIHLFCEFRDQASYVVARNEFNIDNGFTIIQPSPSDESTELFYFATKRENCGHTHLYTTHLDSFYRFILYFKEKARYLIKQANKEKFFIETLPIDSPIFDNTKIKSEFYAETSINKLHMKFNNIEIVLSKREIDCLYLTMKNKTSKEIGQMLSISPRTVETYVSNVKLKSNCQTKKELISRFTTDPYKFLVTNAAK
jgi:DNA-binding CsgD family transcriptional regulator